MKMIVILFLTIIFASFMKLADLAEEHNIKFKFGLKYLFAVIWGVAGSFAVASGNAVVSSYFIALMFSYILRFRIDTFIHGLSAVIVLSPLLIRDVYISLPIFFACFIIMVGFGYVHDGLDNNRRVKKILLKNRALFLFFEYRMFYYTLFIFVAIIFKEWLLFAIPLLGMGSYEIVRQIGERIERNEKRKVNKK